MCAILCFLGPTLYNININEAEPCEVYFSDSEAGSSSIVHNALYCHAV